MNKILYDNNAIKIINNALNLAATNPKIQCKLINENNLSINQEFILDDGALEILKAYYKSKLENK